MTLPFPDKPFIEFTVPGEPATQGSARALMIGGKPRVIHDSKRTGPWRKQAEKAAFVAMCKYRARPWDCPVLVDATFVLPWPKRRVRPVPSVQPDLDKLCRALGDALEGVVVTNDSRIVEWRARKTYGDPCVLVRVEVI